MERYLKLYGFYKTKNGFWIRGDGWLVMLYKPYYATNRWKVEFKNHSFLITDQFELAKLMRALIEDWDLTDFPYNNLNPTITDYVSEVLPIPTITNKSAHAMT